jgi:hypothetical protein
MLERMRERWPLVRLLLGWVVLYLVLMTASLALIVRYPASPWRYLPLLLSVVAWIGLMVGVARAVYRLDELGRKVILESVGLSFMATLSLLLTLGMLSAVGMEFPGETYMFVAMFMGLVVLVAKLLLSRWYE